MRLADLYKLSLVKEVNLMDYEYIESLVLQAKDGNEDAKEKLCFEFKPLIMKTSSRTFIHGYDFQDIENECYRMDTGLLMDIQPGYILFKNKIIYIKDIYEIN